MSSLLLLTFRNVGYRPEAVLVLKCESMNKSIFSNLASELEELGIPKSSFSLEHPRNERTCLIYSEGKWLVYYSERGGLTDLLEFNNFDEAKTNFIGRLI